MSDETLEDSFFSERMKRLFGPVPPTKIALAVSGGPDSMGLAVIASRWAKKSGTELWAFIVDHRLRLESETEAESVKRRLEALDIPTEIHVWEHDDVPTRLHVKARDARYAFLFAACKAHGINYLFLAHQAEDQAETVLFRFAKGSGIDGLAGMAESIERDGITLVRPLLDMPKARLIATCEAANVAYVTDPSNAKTHYARGRLRKLQDLLAEEGFTTERLLDLAARARDAQEALNAAMGDFLKNAAKTDVFGVIRVERAPYGTLPREIALRALTACLQKLAPAPYAPKRESLLLLHEALAAPDFTQYALHGCLITRKQDEITLFREEAALHDALPIAPGETLVWDKVWQITLNGDAKAPTLQATYLGGKEASEEEPSVPQKPTPSKDFEIRALGLQTHETLDHLAPRLRKACPEGRARAALPALWKEDKLIAIASFEGEKENGRA